MPPSPRLLAGLSEVADRYDAILCDVWGVVHDGVSADTDACAALARFGAERGPVVLISNSPRPSPEVVPQLESLNVPATAWSAIVTSGDATRVELAKRAPGPAWKIGPERDEHLYAGLGLRFADAPEGAAFLSCTGPVDDDVETPEDYRARLTRAARCGLTMVCANPDRVVQKGDRLIYCAGALADLYETLGGEVVMAGKPYAPIYALAVAQAERLAGQPLNRRRMLCIGDGLRTDVAGANGQDLDCLFIGAGIHAEQVLADDGKLRPDRVEALLRGEGAHAAYAMATLSA